MKKLFTLLTILLLLSASTANTVFANGTVSSSEEKVAVSMLMKPIDRKAINELLLNEMQYIQLKNLSKQYQRDLSSLTNLSLMEKTPKDANLQLLNSRYYKELSSILSSNQIQIFVAQNNIAVN